MRDTTDRPTDRRPTVGKLLPDDLPTPRLLELRRRYLEGAAASAPPWYVASLLTQIAERLGEREGRAA